MSPQLVKALKDQAGLVMNASQKMLAVSLWAKQYGWKGAHEWTGDFSKDLRKHVKGIGKLLLDYAQTDYDVPGTDNHPCKVANYPDIWRQVRECVMEEQAGWVSIAQLAEDLGETDIDDFADHYMTIGTGMVKKLNRWNNEMDQIAGNTAGWKHFDKLRRR
jgi:ferritin